MSARRLGLGTAQFGKHYGVTNKLGRPSNSECEDIVDTAIEAGIRYFDTAAYYDDADVILSRSLPRTGCRVVTKCATPSQVWQSVDLFGDQLYAVLSSNVMAHGIEKNGISVYWPTSIDPEAQIVQMPLNIVDQRNARLAAIYRDMGVEVHARSVFLQGLLLERGATLRQCLKYALDHADIAIVGVNSADELKQIIEAAETLDQDTSTEIPHIEPHLLDPRSWNAHS